MRHTHVGVRATLAVLLLASCSGDDSDGGKDGQAASTSTTAAAESTTTTTAPPTTTTTTTAPLPVSPGVCPAIPPRAHPRDDRTRYDLTVNVDPPANTVTGTVKARFTPDLATDRLVLRLWPNAPRTARAGARQSVTAVRVEGAATPYQQPDATTVVITRATAANSTVHVEADFAMALPRPVDDRVSRSNDAVRLGSFFPYLAWEPGVGWATDPPTSAFAEASTAATADFVATVNVPAGFDVLATGVRHPDGRWRAEHVSDFALSVGHFRLASGRTPQGTEVTVGVDSQLTDNPFAYLNRVVKAIDDFSTRYGPYPWPAYSLAITPNLRGGIEYPMHVLQGPGTQGRTTSHEVAHMWFYGLVSNNQGRNPWLDEGLASWAEFRHEGTLGRHLPPGYSIPASGRGRAGQPMTFWESRQSAYYRSVYVQPAQALAALGNPDLVDCALRLYVARTAHRVATPKDLLDALGAVFPNAAATLAPFGLTA